MLGHGCVHVSIRLIAEAIIFFLPGGEPQTVQSSTARRANAVGRNKCCSYILTYWDWCFMAIQAVPGLQETGYLKVSGTKFQVACVGNGVGL
ncbi:hypothetical protein EIKCOROL_00440 [Eikenella corrodens ATCC 23834]|uniref:Uncharacterized protein n=1 Tax=Eikenella corrodens ATCC 23834 TaxID=546274 RepID=C0DSW8_EIKCO|nr:hypothetical protein EIKCOROL_00440 [Eikenella corrodens ATCC 23834]